MGVNPIRLLHRKCKDYLGLTSGIATVSMNKPETPPPAAAKRPQAESDAEVERFLASHPEVESFDCLFVDMHGTLRGKRYPRAEAAKIVESGVQIPQTVYLLDARGEMTDPLGHGFGDGDPDGTGHPVLSTLSKVAFSAPPRGQVLMTLVDQSGKPAAVEPRNQLAGVLEKFRAIGLTPVVAIELEFFLLDVKRDENGRIQPPLRPGTGEREKAAAVYGIDDLDSYKSFIETVREAVAIENVPATAASVEYAPGQFEINLKHQPDALAAADHAIFLRQCVKEAAKQQGMRATFMSKPYADRAGSGMHIHMSLLDKNGRNVFAAGAAEDNKMLRYAAGGLGAIMHEAMAVFSQNVNAYRRYVENLFVPMNRNWGVNNRSTGIRVPAGSPEQRRIEHRVAGADANPYLALACVLAGVHHGITQKIDAGPPSTGNASKPVDRSVPFAFDAAIEAFANGKILRRYFGDYVDLYCASKRKELARYRAEIPPHEYDWYL